MKRFIKDNSLLAKNIIGSYLLKGLALVISFFTLPAYINYFSDNQIVGVWFTLVSIIQWVFIFDLGLGNGLRNRIVPLLLADNVVELKKYISSSYFIITIVSLIFLLVGIPVLFLIDWNVFFKVSINVISLETIRLSVFIVLLSIIIQFILKTILSILYAMKKVALSNFIAFLSSLIIFFYVLVFKTGDSRQNMINLSIVNLLALNVPLILATIFIFSTKLIKCVPNLKYVSRTTCFDVIKLGSSFFYIQIALLVINLTNEFLITWLFGAEYVVEYLIYFRVFHLSVTFFTLLSNPLWSEISELHVLNNKPKIKGIYRNTNIIVLLSILGNVIVLCLLQPLFDIWLGENSIPVNYVYGIIFILLSTITIYNMALSIFANAINKLKTQMISFSAGMILKVPIVFILYFLFQNWIAIVIGTIVVILPYAAIQPAIIKKQLDI